MWTRSSSPRFGGPKGDLIEHYRSVAEWEAGALKPERFTLSTIGGPPTEPNPWD